MKKGDKVKFNAPTGSVGIVEYAGNGHLYVRYHYGLDVKGAPMTSLSGQLRPGELVPISDEEFDAVAFSPGFGTGQSSAWPLEEETTTRLNDEAKRARAKFPGNRLLLAALTKEVGELSKALLQRASRDEVEKEALQVACVALRILEEGDATFNDVSDAESKK